MKNIHSPYPVFEIGVRIAVCVLAFTLAAGAQLTIVTGSPLPDATVGNSYSVTLSATGNAGTVRWLLGEGTSLPSGLTLDSPSGRISGTPTIADLYRFTIYAIDAQENFSQKEFLLNINPASGPLNITTPAQLPVAGVSVGYAVTIAATGGVPPYNYSTNLTQLPPGLVLNANSGILSGTPSVAGDYSFLVTVRDAQQNSAEKTFFLRVSAAVSSPSIVTASPLPVATLGNSYLLNFAVSGGEAPYQFFVQSGSLPPGLTLNSTAGTLTGTPTQEGLFSFSIDVVDSGERVGNKAFQLTVGAGLRIVTNSLPAGLTGSAYPATPIVVEGGAPPYAFSLGQANLIPPGLLLNPTTGSITGTPTQAGLFQFSVVVRDLDNRQTARTYSIEVIQGVRFRTISPLPTATIGTSYSQPIEVEGGTAPYQFVMVGAALPAGLRLDLNSGLISGTPTASFNGTVRIRATDSGNPQSSAERSFQFRVAEALSISTSSLSGGVVGQAYSAVLTAVGGVPAYTFSLAEGNLPAGLLLAASGTISGTPTAAGAFPFTVRVTDQEQRSATAAISIQIRPESIPGVTVTLSTPNPSGNTQQDVGVNVSQAQPVEISGALTLTFVPSVTPAVDDPAVQFVSGSRESPFRIPANATSAVFGEAQAARFQTGTVAGEIRIRARLEVDSADATPNPPPSATIVIAPVAPTLTSLEVQRGANGLTVRIRGFSTPRNMNSATLNFTARAGSNTQGGLSFTVPLGPEFATWYQGAASVPFGSQFLLTIPVTITGDPAEITGLSVRLSNSVGDSNSLSAQF